MDRTQFTFYESFYRAVSRISDPSARAQAYDAICAYALYGEEPVLENLSDCAAVALELIRPFLDASRRKAENGKAGGKSKQTEPKPEANDKQTESKPEANDKQAEANGEDTESKYKNKNKNKNKYKYKNKCYGAYGNVILSDEDIEKLKAEFPTDWGDRIERLSEYMAGHTTHYKSHIAVIRSWARRDQEQGRPAKGIKTGSTDVARADDMAAMDAYLARMRSEADDGRP